MKKTFKILILLFVLFLSLSSVCLATDFVTTSAEKPENVTTISNTNNDVYDGNSEVVLSGYVNGNSFLFGNKVTVSGYVSGDLFVLASELVIDENAEITGNLFALAQQITLNGKVRDVYSLSQEFSLGNNGFITRNLNLYSGNVKFEGKIGRDANISASSITFAENAKNVIGRDLKYSAQQEFSIPEGAVVGEIKFSQITQKEPDLSETISNYINNFISVILYSAVVILLATFVTPDFAEKATYRMSKKPFASVTFGIVAFIAIPLLSIIFLFTGFLAYVGIALVTLYLLVLSITISILGIAIGNYFANKLKDKTKTKCILLSLASVAVLWGLQKIPFVGGYISLFTIVFGLGIFVCTLFTKKPLEETKK